jgi:hypothetical protein
MGTRLYFGQLPAVRYLLLCIYPSRFVHGSQRLLVPLPPTTKSRRHLNSSMSAVRNTR